MVDTGNPDERNQESKATDTSVTQPATTAQKPAAKTDASGDPQPPQPILVQLVGGDDLEPFEERTLALTRDSLETSRRTHRVAVFGFWAAVAAATFVGIQVKEMSYQTQIMGSQSESAAAGAALGELNTRKQLAIAQKQARAAQDGVTAVQSQTQADQRAWVQMGTIPNGIDTVDNAPITARVFIGTIGKSPAKNISGGFAMDVYGSNEMPELDLGSKHTLDHFSTGISFPNDTHGFQIEVFNRSVPSKIKPPLVLPDINEKVNAGESYVVIWGKTTYDDIFGIHHWVRFCGLVGTIPRQTHAKSIYDKARAKCATYNDVDENPN